MENELRFELLVSGYIRSNCAVDIPSDIVFLCVLWYKIQKDYWSQEHIDEENVTINEERNIVTGSHFAVVTGSVIISKSLHSKIWRLKFVNVYGRTSFSVIGLYPVGKDQDEIEYKIDLFYGNARCTRDGQDISTKVLPHGSVRIDDVLVIKYETIYNTADDKDCHGQLFIGKNDEEMKKAFDDIPIKNDEKYRFAVLFYISAETLELLE